MTNIEIIFSLVETIIGAASLILVVFGWIIPLKHSSKMEKAKIHHENEIEAIRWKKSLLDKQISQLYGPIYSLLSEMDTIRNRVMYQLGQYHAFSAGMSLSDMPEENQLIWKHYVDNYKIKQQLEIVKIIRENIHLMYKSEIPRCYDEFLDYALGWELLDNQKRNNVPNFYDYHYTTNFPVDFKSYIIKTLSTLQKEQMELEKKLETI